MRFTQQILGKKAKPALEDEGVVDQNTIDNMSDEIGEGAETPATPEVEPSTDTVEETPATDPEEGDAPEETPEGEPAPVETAPEGDVTPAEGDEVVPPSADEAEAGEINPTTDSGEVTLDQVNAVVDGKEGDAVDAVVEEDNAQGEPTTPEEVVEEVAEQEAAADDTDVVPEPTAPEGTEVPEEGVEPGQGDAVPEADTQSTDSPEVVAEQDPAGSDETPEVSEDNVPENTEGEPAVEDCACEEGGENPGDSVTEGEGEAVDENATEGAAGTTADEGVPPEASEPVVVEVGPESDAPGEPISEVEAAEGPVGEGLVETDSPVEEEVELPTYPTSEIEYEQEVLGDAIDTYPAVLEVLEEGMNNGGVSVECMAVIKLFTQRDGVDIGSDVSLESFNHTARTQTRIAIESIKESVVEWIKQFIENFKKHALQMINAIKGHFDKLEAVKKIISALKEKISSGAQSAEGEVKFRSIGALTVDNSVDSLANNLSALATFSKSFLALIGTHGQDTAKKVMDLDISDADILAKVRELISQFVNSNVKSILTESSGGYASKVLPGETRAVADVNLDGGKVISLDFAFRKENIESPVDAVKALAVSDVLKAIAAAEELIAVIENSRSVVEKAEGIINEFSASWNSSVDKSNLEGAQVSQVVKDIVKVTNVLAVKPIFALDTYLIRTVVAVSDYANASLK